MAIKFTISKRLSKSFLSLFACLFCVGFLSAQTKVSGKVIEAATGNPILGATVAIKGQPTTTNTAAITDFDGNFEFNTTLAGNHTLVVSIMGFESTEVPFEGKPVSVKLAEEGRVMDLGVVIKASRISDEQKKDPRTVEQIDPIAIKNASAANFYEEAGKLKGVDLMTAAIGFTIINTRGFNSTSPVRSLQIIDGVDNQSPGLNFSLGNFLGSSELDVLKMDLIVGANSAYYGPNAFNGVISMETKNPFFQNGLAASVKYGERSLTDIAARYADVLKNSAGKPWMAYKLNMSYLTANDWQADNYEPVYGSQLGKDNPGGYDKVNVYGDEYNSSFSATDNPFPQQYIGLGKFTRTGYREVDLVDYHTKNIKANVAFHFRLKPSEEEKSPELILSSSMGNGTTIYQGDNRFSLRDIYFFQQRLELRKRDKYFLRFYATNEDAGRSFDPYFTALLLQDSAKSNLRWSGDYLAHWAQQVDNQAYATGYPRLKVEFDPITGMVKTSFDTAQARDWYARSQGFLQNAHLAAANAANTGSRSDEQSRFTPGTAAFQTLFDQITSTVSSTKRGSTINGLGTRFYDRSALYHGHGEYHFKPKGLTDWVVGANGRLYAPNTAGSIFSDTAGRKITVFEYGIYTGIEKQLGKGGEGINTFTKWRLNATVRLDKNQNFSYLVSPAASAVWQPTKVDFVRVSLSAAIRNPTLSDQYLNLNVGPAILAGSNSQVDSLLTVSSFLKYISGGSKRDLVYFNLPKIQPEKVQTIEVGYRTTLLQKVFMDASYYFSRYQDFIGYQLGIKTIIDPSTGYATNTQVFRHAANSKNAVTTQGFSIGLNYYFVENYSLSGNYSWNRLNTTIDDPIIPAFNTPENKFNLSISGRNILLRKKDKGNPNANTLGFGVNYKWVQGFLYEGSPQFTGNIPTYFLVDAQANYTLKKQNLTFKLGASNLLNRLQFQTYGGPRIGRMAYISATYDFQRKQ
ncbi:MAG: hypothetical protein RL757_1620 [Bacteroidota bacterium]|jgi:outer membrane receptor protein involved in Fe transport